MANTASRAADLVGNDVLASALFGAGTDDLGAQFGGELAMGTLGLGPSDTGTASLSTMRRVMRRATAGLPDEHVDEALHLARSSSGQALPKRHRERLEAAFDHDFDHVRVHVGGQADRASALLEAHAFALGAELFFRSGTYAPGTARGDELLAHELTHVVQHDEGRLPSGGGVSLPTDPHEVEAYANQNVIVRRLARLDQLPEDLQTDVSGSALDSAVSQQPQGLEGLMAGPASDHASTSTAQGGELAAPSRRAATAPTPSDPFQDLFEADDWLYELEDKVDEVDAQVLAAALAQPDPTQLSQAVALARQMARKLGLPGPVPIRLDADAAALTSALGVPGVYSRGEILLDPAIFNVDNPDSVRTLAHEMVHAAQATLGPTPGASLATAEFEAHHLADDLARGAQVDAPVVGLPSTAVATDGPNFDVSSSFEGLRANAESLTDALEGRVGDMRVDDRDLESGDGDAGSNNREWRRGLRATADELGDSPACEALWEAIHNDEPFASQYARVRGTEEWTDLVEMYKSTIKDEEDGAAKQALWESTFSSRGWYNSTKRMWRMIARDAKAEAQFSAEEEEAAAQAEEARAHEPEPVSQPETLDGPDQGAEGADHPLSNLFEAADIDLTAIEVDPATPPTPEWDKARTDDGNRPAYDRVAEQLAHMSTARERAASENSEAGSRFWNTTVGLVGGAAGGFVEGLQSGVVDTLKEKLIFDQIDGFLNRTIGAKAGLSNVQFVSKGLAVYDMITGDPVGEVMENWDGMTESWGSVGSYFDGSAWEHCDGALDYVGVFFAMLADMAQAICDTINFVEDIVSKISTVMWGLGLALIIIGFCLLWWGIGAGIIAAGKKLISVGKFFDKISTALKAVVPPIKLFGTVCNVLASYLVPEELYVERFNAAQEGVSDLASDAGEVVGSTVVEHSIETYQQRRAESEANDPDTTTPESVDTMEGGSEDADQLFSDAADQLEENRQAVEQVHQETEAARQQAESEGSGGNDSDSPSFGERLSSNMQKEFSYVNCLNPFSSASRQAARQEIGDKFRDVGQQARLLRAELGAPLRSDGDNLLQLRQDNDRMIEETQASIESYEQDLAAMRAEVAEAQQHLANLSSEDREAVAEAELAVRGAQLELSLYERQRDQAQRDLRDLRAFNKAFDDSPIAFEQVSERERQAHEREARGQLANTEAERDRLQGELETNETQRQAVQERIDEIESQVQVTAFSGQTDSAVGMQMELSELREQQRTLDGAHEELSQQHRAAEQEVRTSQDEVERFALADDDAGPMAQWYAGVRGRYEATRDNDAHDAPMGDSAEKLAELLGGGVVRLFGTPKDIGDDEGAVQAARAGEGNDRPFEAALNTWDNLGNMLTVGINNTFGSPALNVVLFDDAPIQEMSELDEKFEEAENNIQRFINHYEIAHAAYEAEQAIATQIQVQQELDETVGETADEGVEAMAGPLQEGLTNASQRSAQIHGVDTGDQEPDPEIEARSAEAAAEMNNNSDRISGGSSGGETADAASSTADAQSAADEETDRGKEEGGEASDQQVELMQTLNTGQDLLSNQVDETRAAVQEKTQRDTQTLEGIRSEKSDHLQLAIQHRSEGESAAAEYNSDLAEAAKWADDYKKAREDYGANF